MFDKSLREQIVFSDHSLATDSVFAEMQLVSCRNVLIYFTRDLQDRALGLFREALCHKGFLGIGSKESLQFSAAADAFDRVRAARAHLSQEGGRMSAATLHGRIDAVVIGASAGGVEALLRMLPTLGRSLPTPIVVVLHLPRERPSLLASVLGARCALPVVEAEDKMPLADGTIYFAPPDYHLLLERGASFALSTDELVHFSRPSIDVLFDSAADVFGARLAAVLLTGANEDGAAGLATVRRRGGTTIVQDPETALVSTMPLAAIALGAADHVLPLDDIAALLRTLDVPREGRSPHDPSHPNCNPREDPAGRRPAGEPARAVGAAAGDDGVELLEARSGAEALELLLVHEVCLALVDVQMPEMDGFELAELMRGSERTRGVPIIFVTAGARDALRVFKGYESGAVDFLFKPIDPHILRSKVDVFIELALQRQRLAFALKEKTETLRLQEMFTAMLGHDLRGPLSAIVMGSILLERKATDEATRRSAARTLSSAKLMGHMIADMLDLARVRLAGGIPIRRLPVDLGDAPAAVDRRAARVARRTGRSS